MGVEDEGIAPSVQHGADFIEKCFTREYKQACVDGWRRRFGDDLANQIIDELKKRKRAKKTTKVQNQGHSQL